MIAALALLLAAPAQAGASLPSAQAQGMELAALLDPEPMLAAANVRLHLRRLDAVAAQDAELRAFRTANPAGYAAIAAACEQAVRADIAKFYPTLQAANAEVYVRDLTADDFRVLLAYYRGPLGLKVVAAGFAAMNGATEADRAAAREVAMAGLSPEERAQVAALAATTAAQHLHVAYAERQENGRTWAVRNAPTINADVAAAMAKAADPASANQPRAEPTP